MTNIINQLIDDYIKYDQNFDATCNKMNECGFIDVFDKCANKTEEETYQIIFEHAIYFGFLTIVKFLYEVRNVSYNTDIFDNYSKVLDSKQFCGMSVQVETGLTNDTTLRISVLDKYSVARNECFEYLLSMKKYSTMHYGNKKWIYNLNKKYITNV